MRKTFTIWLVLGALMLSLFGNVLAVSVQASDIDPEAGLVTDNLSDTESEQVSQSDAEAVIPQTEDKQTEDDTAKDIEQPVTDPAVDSEEEPVDQESGQAEDSESPVDAAGDLEETQKQPEEDEPASEEDIAGEATDLEASSAEKDSPAEEEINTTEAEAEEDSEPAEESEKAPAENADSDSEEDTDEAADAEECAEDSDEAAEEAAEEDTQAEEGVVSYQDTEIVESSLSETEITGDAEADLAQGEKTETDTQDVLSQILEASPTLQAVKGVGEVIVTSFEELKKAINEASEVIIVIAKSFEITETVTIAKDKNITLTANNKKAADGEWNKIEQPADYADQGEEKQREIIEEARRRGDEALDHGDLTKNPLPDEANNIIIKRAETFLNGTLFKVLGKLTLGTEDKALYVDGNETVTTKFDDRGVLFDVNEGGDLTLKNGVLMHVNNGHGYSAPIVVKNGGTFTMDGGRISSNKSYEWLEPSWTHPFSAGGVYVKPGGTFNLNNGLIDNNTGTNGGILAGDLFGSTNTQATVNMTGGEVVNNKSKGLYALGGGITMFPKSKLDFTDGIIAGNHSKGNGGGIAVNDDFINGMDNTLNAESAHTHDYDEYLKEFKTEVNLDGGLIYKNKSGYAGGGVYVDSNNVTFGTTMLLDNHAANFGGGFYVAFPPLAQRLDHVLVTENKAIASWIDSLGGGDGGGLWNCPTGFVHLGDRHSVYIFNNQAEGKGDDLGFVRKTISFILNGNEIKDQFYSHISPVTELENLIKFLEDGNASESLIPDRMTYTQLMTYLKAVYNDTLTKEAWGNSKTFILGNSARNGGGIGSNANLVGKNDNGDYDITVEKKWDVSTYPMDDHKYETVIADIFIVPEGVNEAYVRSRYKNDPNLFKYGEITLKNKDGWETIFSEQQDKFKGDIKEDKGYIPWKDFWKDYWDQSMIDTLSEDQKLYFSAEDLRAKGLKYLVMERGNKYVTTVEEKPAVDKTVEVGKIKVSRYESTDEVGQKYNKYFSKDAIIYLYHYDSEGKQMDLLAEGQINKGNGYAVELSDELLKGDIKIEYYGEERDFYEWGQKWQDSIKYGHHSNERGYALILVDNPDGTKTLKIPYLWIQHYDDNQEDMNQRSGFRVEVLDAHESVEVKTNHTFVITNYKPGEAEIQKKWDETVDPEKIPESVTFVLLLDGRPVIESYDDEGCPILKTVTLTKEDGWKGSLGCLNPMYLESGRYTIGEIGNPNFIAEITFEKDNPGEDIEFWIQHNNQYYDAATPNYSIYSDTLLGDYLKGLIDEDHPIELNLILDGQKVDKGYLYWEKREIPVRPGDFFYEINYDKAKFTVKNLQLGGYDVQFGYYDILVDDDKSINEWGLRSYDILLEKNNRGIYTLKLPRLIYRGYPYVFFNVMQKDGFSYNNQLIPHAKPVSYTFSATNFPKPTPPPTPEEPPEGPPEEPPVETPPEEPPETPPENPPYEPPTRKITKGTPPPIITKALIMRLPATSCVQADAKPTAKSAAELVEKVWSELRLNDFVQDLLHTLRQAA